MKHFTLLIVLLSSLISCDKKPSSQNSKNKHTTDSNQITKKIETARDSIGPNPWTAFYQKQDSAFNENEFALISAAPITYLPTSTKATYENGADPIYLPYIFYNPSKTQYVDIDSYLWHLGADGEKSFEADQEIILVDTKEKNKNRVLFFGPSYRVEYAVWKNDQLVQLYGTSDEIIPFKIMLDLKKDSLFYHDYPREINASKRFGTREL